MPSVGLDAAGSQPTRHWHRLDDGRVQCDLCPRACKLHEGQRGLCFVRACVNGSIVLTTYGRSSGFCVDPIEKKPLHHFLPGTTTLSFGTAGCNLACRFCQNWELSKARATAILAVEATPADIASTAARLGCPSVAFTYNDPVVFHEYAIAVAQACRARDIRTVAVTAGYVNPAPRAEFYAHMDAANVDLKAFSDAFYRRVCAGRLEPVLDTLRYLAGTGVWLEITNLVIPGHNDSDDELDRMTAWVVEHLGPDVPMHFTAFHPDFRMRAVPPTTSETLRRARAIARRNGIRHAYTGNLPDPAGATTSCHACGAALIVRAGYVLTGYHLTADGRCPSCATPCPGVFDVVGPRR